MAGMEEGEERGWAPFPVQDWRRLPVDPLRPAPTGPVLGTAYVDPEPASARRGRRPWWTPLVALLLVGALVVGGVWVVHRLAEPATDALRFVPADGAAAYDRVAETRELRTTERRR